jgi:hypothetical protein
MAILVSSASRALRICTSNAAVVLRLKS